MSAYSTWILLWVLPLFFTTGWLGFIIWGVSILILFNVCVCFRAASWASPLWVFFFPILWGKPGPPPKPVLAIDYVHVFLLYGWSVYACYFLFGALIFAIEPRLVKPEPNSINNSFAQNLTIAWFRVLHFAGPEVENQMPIDFYGKIVNEKGQPISHAQVLYLAFDPEKFYWKSFMQRKRLFTGPDGSFRIEDKGTSFWVLPMQFDGYDEFTYQPEPGNWVGDPLEDGVKREDNWPDSIDIPKSVEVFTTVDWHSIHFITPNKDHPFVFRMIHN